MAGGLCSFASWVRAALVQSNFLISTLQNEISQRHCRGVPDPDKADRLSRVETDHPVAVEVLVETGFEHFQRRTGSRTPGAPATLFEV